MTQKIFDIENEEDMALLWSILPDKVFKIHTSEEHTYYSDGDETQYFDVSDLIAINWHDKTEITRPIKESTEADIGNLCYFWDSDSDEDVIKQIGLLTEIKIENSIFKYVLANSVCFAHCRRLTKQEIEELFL